MKTQWSDSNAEAMVEAYSADGVGRDVALRVYTSRLLGGDPRLVLHGGGNTSVKTTTTDIAGDEVEVLCIKGSGWDLGDIEPPGLPAVRLEPLRRLLGIETLSDEDMVNVQRGNLLDSTAPNPSVETLLHAAQGVVGPGDSAAGSVALRCGCVEARRAPAALPRRRRYTRDAAFATAAARRADGGTVAAAAPASHRPPAGRDNRADGNSHSPRTIRRRPGLPEER